MENDLNIVDNCRHLLGKAKKPINPFTNNSNWPFSHTNKTKLIVVEMSVSVHFH